MNDFKRKRRTAKQLLLRRALSRNKHDSETSKPAALLSKSGITVLPSLSRDPKLVRAMQRTLSRSSRERSDRRLKTQTRPKILKNSTAYPMLNNDSRSWKKVKTYDGPRSKHLLEGKSGASLGAAASRGSSRSRYSSSAYPSTWAMDVRMQEEKAHETSNSLEEVYNCTPLNRTPYDHQLSRPLKSDQSVLCSMKTAARRLGQRRKKQTQPKPKSAQAQPRSMCVAQTQTLPKQSAKGEPQLHQYKPPKKSYKPMFTSVVEEKFLGSSRSSSETSEISFRKRKTRHRVSSGEDVKRSKAKPTARRNQIQVAKKRDLTDYGGYTPSDVSLSQVPIKQMSNTGLPRGTGGHRNEDSPYTMRLPTEKEIQNYKDEAASEDCMTCSVRGRMPNRYAETSSANSYPSGHCICESVDGKRQNPSLSRRGSRATTTDASSSSSRMSRQSRGRSRRPMTRRASRSSISNEPRSSHRRTRDRPNRESRRSRNSFSTDSRRSSIGNRKEHAKSQRKSHASHETSRIASDQGHAKSRGKSSASRRNSQQRDKGNSKRRGSGMEKIRRRSSVEVIPVEIGAENLRKSMQSLHQSSRHQRTDLCKDPNCKRKCRKCAEASTLTSEHLLGAAATGLSSTRGGSLSNVNTPRYPTNSCGICPVTKTCDPKCAEASAQTSQHMMMRPSHSRASMDIPRASNHLVEAQRSRLSRRPSEQRLSQDPQSPGWSNFQSRRTSAANGSTISQQGPSCYTCPHAICPLKCLEACTQTCSFNARRSTTTREDSSGIDECDVGRIIEILQTALAGLEMEKRARVRGSTNRIFEGGQSRVSQSHGISGSNADNVYESEATDGTYSRPFDPYQHTMCYCPHDMYMGASNLMGQTMPFLNVDSLHPATKRILHYVNKITGKAPEERRTKPEKQSGSSEKFVELMGQSRDEKEAPHSSTSKTSYLRYNEDHSDGPDNTPVYRKNRTNSPLKSHYGTKQRFTAPHLASKFRETRGRSKVRELVGSYCPVFGIKSQKRSNIFLSPNPCSKYVPIRHEQDSNYKKYLLSKGRTENCHSEGERRGRRCCQTKNNLSEGERRGQNNLSEGELRARARFPAENILSEEELRGETRFPEEITRSRDSDRSTDTYTRDADVKSKRRRRETKKRRSTGNASVTMSFLNAYEARIFKDFEKYKETKTAEAAAPAEEPEQDDLVAATAGESICQQEPVCPIYLQCQQEEQIAIATAAPKKCLQDPICKHCQLMQKEREKRRLQNEKNEMQTQKKSSMFSVNEKKQPQSKKGPSKSSIQTKNQSKEPKISGENQPKEKKPSKSKGIFSWCLKKDKNRSEEKLKLEDGKLKENVEKQNSQQNEGTIKESQSQVVKSNSSILLKKSPSSQTYEYERIPEEQSPPTSQPIPDKKVIEPEAKTHENTTGNILKLAANFYNNECPRFDARNDVRVLYDSSARFARDTYSVRVLPDPPIPAKPRFGDYSTSSCSSIVGQCYGGQQQQQEEYKMPQKNVSTNAFYSMFQQQNPFLKKRNCDCEFQRKWDIF
ncbi:uncharacterized protein LOC111069175 [Drosophila obscura]|uniref:uncharacterized protein LOC111069175 n=1 Tax=Drosophila obscura TaxID=7282 RepID=UPI001BB1AC7A|nr:uncharacterized protein LOC111069175 [Drosophila obscura]